MGNTKEFKPGDMWSMNFDYEGMLRYGENITVKDDVNELEKLLRSLEDVNYHREAEPLYNMIEAIKEKNMSSEDEEVQRECMEEIVYYYKKFQKEIYNTLNS